MKNTLYPDKQYIRFFNASNNDKLSFYMFNKCECTNISVGEITSYVQADCGTNSFKICDYSGNQVASAFCDIYPGGLYTVCAIGKENSYSIYIIEDKSQKSNSNYAALRIAMLSSEYTLTNLCADGQNVICHIKPMDVSNYVAFLPGTYNFELRNFSYTNSPDIKETDKPILIDRKIHLNAGERYNLLVYDDEASGDMLLTLA